MSKYSTDESKAMKHVFQQAADKNVEAYVVYGKTADYKLYYEAAYTNQVEQAVIADAFRKNMLVIFDGTTYWHPVKLSANKVSTIDTVSTALAFVEWTAKAAE